jgi:uroporphyrinogen decarboxylase
MLPIERVKAAIHFKKPDRVPTFNLMSGDVLPLIVTPSKRWKPGWNVGEEGLFPHIRGNFDWDRPDWAKVPKFEGNNWKSLPHEEIDEWGSIWNMKGNDENMGHPSRAVILDWKDLDNFMAKYKPNAKDESRYQSALNIKTKVNNNHYLMIIPPTFGPSGIVSGLRGFNQYLLDHKRHPHELKRALDLVAEYHVDLMKNSYRYGIKPHGIWMLDDFGEQKGPFFSPNTFKKHYESPYRYIIDEAHALGMEVHLHCCGKIDPLLPVFIECGLDAIELDSPRMSGYSDLAPYRGNIMFWACINIQSIYPLGTPEEIKREIWHMVRNLGTKEGGFGAYFYPRPNDLKIPLKNIQAFEKGLEIYGDYSKIPKHWWDYPIIDKWNDSEVPPLPPLKL